MDNSLKDKVLEAVDIVEVVGERVQLTRKGKDYLGLCPFHADRHPSLSVSPSKRIFKCWACGAGGDAIRFVQLYERVSFREALSILARRVGIDFNLSPSQPRAAQLRERIRAVVTWAQTYFQANLAAPSGRRARDYALSRGLKAETVTNFGLGFATDAWDGLLTAARKAGLPIEALHHAGLVVSNEAGKSYDRFRNRLIFPIMDPLGRPIAFGGRTLGDDPAKYLNSPETVLFSKSRVLYGLNWARSAIQAEDAAIIVEGYLDAVMLSQFGIQNVVATLGTALSDAQVKLLQPLAGTLYLCFDADNAGLKAANRAVEVALSSRCQTRVVRLPAGQDPADYVLNAGPDGFRTHLQRAVDALEFKWAQTVSGFAAGDWRGRRTAIEEFIRFVAAAAACGGVDPIQQDLLIGRLSELLGVPPEEVFELLTAQKRLVRRPSAGPSLNGGPVSSYETTLRGLSAGLVTAMETVLGLLIQAPACWQWADPTVQAGAERSETWRELYGLLLELRGEVGEYSLGDVIARCERGALCELVDRVRARSEGLEPGEAAFSVARQRLASELDLLRLGQLRDGLRTSGGEDEATFRLLCEAARKRDSLLSPDRRRGVPYTPAS